MCLSLLYCLTHGALPYNGNKENRMSKSLTFKINDDLDLDKQDFILGLSAYLTSQLITGNLDNWEGSNAEDAMMELDQLGITTIIND